VLLCEATRGDVGVSACEVGGLCVLVGVDGPISTGPLIFITLAGAVVVSTRNVPLLWVLIGTDGPSRAEPLTFVDVSDSLGTIARAYPSVWVPACSGSSVSI
jgi:hypothetical protein